MLVHFHDEYQMHDIFLPGFPGLLEAIYIQERITEKMLPHVYASFVRHFHFLFSCMSHMTDFGSLVFFFAFTEETHDLNHKLCDEVVHHVICK